MSTQVKFKKALTTEELEKTQHRRMLLRSFMYTLNYLGLHMRIPRHRGHAVHEFSLKYGCPKWEETIENYETRIHTLRNRQKRERLNLP